ncbi:glycine-rich RNA-binding protein 6 mitochondrial-like [Prunus yedoensis var. nudiflora]|uniref:Glycine-rich RNA-binding protein 6 mitochondrial-like n=1 Tax=Prunus yedoensis var. nudiflora TaxID=2094558 RepID=A0A314YPA5_PRUYE|nr:glycine-rich RNA-binding protein 6 mitochondrial-like [Prunus yedoensis var. nudiflora]
MALRAGLVRRFLSTAIFASESRAAATAASSAYASAADSNNISDKATAEPNTTLFVAGLNKRTTPEKLNEAFSQFGEVVNVKVVIDRDSGFSKGYGFVNYATLEDAEKGVKGMDAQFLDGWVIFTEFARPKRIPGQ